MRNGPKVNRAVARERWSGKDQEANRERVNRKGQTFGERAFHEGLTMSSHSDFQTESKRPRKDSPERKRTKGQFNAIRERWLRAVLADSRLTAATKIVATALFLYFNQKHWGETGELLAWPSWETLIEETATSKRSIAYAIADLEANGALDADHGRFDPKTGKREHNVYKAKMRRHQVQNLHVDQVQNLHVDQVQDQVQNLQKQGAKFAQDSSDDSPSKDSFRFSIQKSGRERAIDSRFSKEDVDWVRNLVLAYAGAGGRMPISEIVARCRAKTQGKNGMGVNYYPGITGDKIAAMAKAGHLHRDGQDVWADDDVTVT